MFTVNSFTHHGTVNRSGRKCSPVRLYLWRSIFTLFMAALISPRISQAGDSEVESRLRQLLAAIDRHSIAGVPTLTKEAAIRLAALGESGLAAELLRPSGTTQHKEIDRAMARALARRGEMEAALALLPDTGNVLFDGVESLDIALVAAAAGHMDAAAVLCKETVETVYSSASWEECAPLACIASIILNDLCLRSIDADSLVVALVVRSSESSGDADDRTRVCRLARSGIQTMIAKPGDRASALAELSNAGTLAQQFTAERVRYFEVSLLSMPFFGDIERRVTCNALVKSVARDGELPAEIQDLLIEECFITGHFAALAELAAKCGISDDHLDELSDQAIRLLLAGSRFEDALAVARSCTSRSDRTAGILAVATALHIDQSHRLLANNLWESRLASYSSSNPWTSNLSSDEIRFSPKCPGSWSHLYEIPSAFSVMSMVRARRPARRLTTAAAAAHARFVGEVDRGALARDADNMDVYAAAKSYHRVAGSEATLAWVTRIERETVRLRGLCGVVDSFLTESDAPEVRLRIAEIVRRLPPASHWSQNARIAERICRPLSDIGFSVGGSIDQGREDCLQCERLVNP